MSNNENRITLRAARVNAGYTQREAAKLLEKSVKTIQNYENGVTVPDWQTVKNIEALYSRNSDSIIFFKNYA